ncbi:acetylglutamate kinase [Daejeonella lutea]|uniref:Acetylglutamate kinase n=1 Tax=Daejeonella lutea TaxID=572036 RepID=A0A1T5DAQ3_9SPHI|nr:acetylglutamate kinase [Daejeonella lutea]SKB68691.1 N-acetylglutamate kinase [Daejeonella lutea]
MNSLYVIKIGGNIIDDPAELESFLKDFSQLEGYKILVHGGGKIATKLAKDLGIESELIEGRRVTDAESLKVVAMVYAGLINKNIVASLQSNNCNAIGLAGADGNIIQAVKRPLKTIADGRQIDYGFVGDLDDSSVDSEAIHKLLNAGFVPVFSAITHDGQGQLLNTNADTIASVIAVSMSGYYQTSLVYCFEKNGVLRDVDDETSIIKSIDPVKYKELKEDGVIHSGMIPKLDNAFEAISKGLNEVCIGRADALPELKQKTFGTRLKSKE